MTIHSKQPLTLAEVKEIVGKMEEKQDMKEYLKKFTKLSKDKSEKLKEALNELKSMKMTEEHAVKIVDFVPQDAEDLNKIFADTGLTEEETNAILEITKKY
jgi:DNA-directed RNA polymerase subunit F